jgi:predicted ATPase
VDHRGAARRARTRAIETQSRFELVFEQFLGAFASDQRTLVLYLDDLQWADSASLRLLEVALTGSVLHQTIHDWWLSDGVEGRRCSSARVGFAADLAKRGVSIDQVSLGPLAPHQRLRVLADALGTLSRHTARLGSALTEKTGGNPFFSGNC